MDSAKNRRDTSIAIRTTAEIRDALLQAAYKQERSMSWLVENLVKRFLENEGYLKSNENAIGIRNRHAGIPESN